MKRSAMESGVKQSQSGLGKVQSLTALIKSMPSRLRRMPALAASDMKDSLFRLRQTRTLVTAGMLLALQVLLGFVAAIPVGPTIRISFGYLALASAGSLLGPVPAMLNGALADVLGFLIKPTGPYFPGFTITGLVSGLIYGFGLYRREPSVPSVLAVKLAIDIVCNLLLNTLWLNILYGKAFWVILPGRLLKNAAQYPVDVLLLYPMLKLVRKIDRLR